jgi:peptidylprolyl isomerase
MMNVLVDYTLKLSYDGEVFDTSIGKEPLNFQLGSGMVIEGFEKAVKSLNVGESGNFTILPDEGYGWTLDELIQKVPKNQVPDGVKVGNELRGLNSMGEEYSVIVSEVSDDYITVDANHPLAGKTLYFDIKLIEKN